MKEVYIIFLAVAILGITIVSCNNKFQKGLSEASSSIEDSKQRKLFIKSIPFTSIKPAKDSLDLKIKNCWLEHKSAKSIEAPIRRTSKRLVIEFWESPFSRTYLTEWSIILKENWRKPLSDGQGSTVYLADPEKYNLLDFYIIEGRSNVGDSTEINKRLMGTMQLGMNGKVN